MAIRVLFVEDSADDVFLAQHALTKAGLRAETLMVQDERELNEALLTWAPDLVVSDFSLPRFDGWSAFSLARQLAPEIPFMFRSGTIGDKRASEALQLGAVGCVEKEHNTQFINLVKQALDRKWQEF